MLRDMWRDGLSVATDADGVEYRVFLTEEASGPEGFFATGDDEADREQCEQIRADMVRNLWAWCVVFVLAKHEDSDAIGSNSLGGCNYASRADFVAGPYFTDMKYEARADLLANLERRAHPTPDATAAGLLARLNA